MLETAQGHSTRKHMKVLLLRLSERPYSTVSIQSKGPSRALHKEAYVQG